MLKGFFVFFIILLGSSCRCDDPVTIDCGKIPDSVLQMVPYQNGQTFKFIHSAGLVINFTASRETREQWLGCNSERCCKYAYKYEVNTTILQPDYPLFSFGFDLSNPGPTPDVFGLGASVGKYWFQIPTDDYQAGYCGFADSILIGDKFYRDVFKIKSIYGSAYDRDTIFADSMYYSYKLGILQIMMSNGEKYSIYE
jgi:hypothetical protein